MDILDSLPAGQYAIYALVDPTDHLVYYVGQTRHPKKRLGEHFKSRRYYGKKAEWLRSLAERGQKPLMQILEIVTGRETALTKEQEWIRHFVEQGRSLLNAQTQPRPTRVTGPLFLSPEKFPFDALHETNLFASMYRYFSPEGEGQPTPEPQPEPTTQPTPEPQPEPTTQPPHNKLGTEPDSAWERLLKALRDIQREWHDKWKEKQAEYERLTQQIAALEERIKALTGKAKAPEQKNAVASGWIPLLSAAHLADMQVLLRSLEQSTGRAQAQLEQEMIETFGVSAMNAIPDEQWHDVLAWGVWRARQPQ